MLITREKYDIPIVAPVGLDLHNTKVVQRYIEDHIAGLIRTRVADFTRKYDESPKVIRLASSDFASLKDAIQREMDKDWMSSANLTLDGIKVKQTCLAGRQMVVLDSELDEDVEEDEE